MSSWTSNGSPASARSTLISTPSGSHARWAVCSARSLGLRQAHVDVHAEPRERHPGGVGLSHALLGQRALVVGGAVGCFGVSEQPEHGQTVRGTTKSSFAAATKDGGSVWEPAAPGAHLLKRVRQGPDDLLDAVQKIHRPRTLAPAILRLGHHQQRVDGLAVPGIGRPGRRLGDQRHVLNLRPSRATCVTFWLSGEPLRADSATECGSGFPTAGELPGASCTGRRSCRPLTAIENWPLDARAYGASCPSSSSLATWPAAKCHAPGWSWKTWRPPVTDAVDAAGDERLGVRRGVDVPQARRDLGERAGDVERGDHGRRAEQRVAVAGRGRQAVGGDARALIGRRHRSAGAVAGDRVDRTRDRRVAGGRQDRLGSPAS